MNVAHVRHFKSLTRVLSMEQYSKLKKLHQESNKIFTTGNQSMDLSNTLDKEIMGRVGDRYRNPLELNLR